MGILDFILKKKNSIHDEFFGKMVFVEFKKKPSNNYFECRRHFKPTNELIEIGIKGNKTGPTKIQKDFFLNIESNFNIITASIQPMLESEFQNWKEDFKIIDFKHEFKAKYLQLPSCKNEPKEWEISFETAHDLNHIFTVTMNDFKATDISIDG